MKKNKLAGKKLNPATMKTIKGAWGGRGYWYMCFDTCEVYYGYCPRDLCPGTCAPDVLCP